MYTVSITSQGQLSIPAELRRKLGLMKKSRAIISNDNGKLVIEPVPDILDLAGVFHKYAKKGLSLDEIIRQEHKAVEEAFIERFIRARF